MAAAIRPSLAAPSMAELGAAGELRLQPSRLTTPCVICAEAIPVQQNSARQRVRKKVVFFILCEIDLLIILEYDFEVTEEADNSTACRRTNPLFAYRANGLRLNNACIPQRVLFSEQR